MYPRWEFSPAHGTMLFGNQKIVHTYPSRWEFIYTINEYQYRGKSIPISNSYGKDNIIVLGDSYSFGTGVNDGEEYTAVMADRLKEHYNVINLSVGGLGVNTTDSEVL